MMILFLHRFRMPLHEWSTVRGGVLFEPLRLFPHLQEKRQLEWISPNSAIFQNLRK